MTTSTPETEDLAETDYDPGLTGSDPAGSGGGAGDFLKRLFLALVKVGLALLILAGLAFGAWLIYRELNRSFDSVIARIERNTRRIEEADAEIDSLQDQNYKRQVELDEVESALATREWEIAALEEELGADLNRHGEELAELEEQARVLDGRASALDQETMALSAGLLALQEDLNASGQQIDALGGEVDALSEMMAALDTRSAELQSQVDELANEDLAGWRQAVALFRIWQMIGRARLRLIESNLGLAADDIELALAAIDEFAGSDSETAPDDLVAIRERLVLAAANLPDDPVAAGRDLETAWEALDTVVARTIIGPENGE